MSCVFAFVHVYVYACIDFLEIISKGGVVRGIDLTNVQAHEHILSFKHFGITVEDCQYAYNSMDVGFHVM